MGHINSRFHGVGMGQYPLSGYVQVGERAVGVKKVRDMGNESAITAVNFFESLSKEVSKIFYDQADNFTK